MSHHQPRLRMLWLALRLAPLLIAAWLPLQARSQGLDLAAIRHYSQPLAEGAVEPGGAVASALKPTDWAWQAVADLVERYGCPVGRSRAWFAQAAPLSRLEAAALLNDCLQQPLESSDTLQRLQRELAPELSVLQGRLKGLEARGARLAALSFAPSTRLSGLATTVVGASRFSGNRSGGAPCANSAAAALTFTYELELGLSTSFNGKDLLFVNLRGGNFAGTPFGGYGISGFLSTLETAFQEFCTPADCVNVLAVDRLLYRWPLGAGFTAILGAVVGQDDLLPLWPSLYPTSTVLNVFTANGAPAAWNRNQGSGAGLWWQQGGVSVAAGYIAAAGDGAAGASGGIGSTGSAGSGSVQLGYSSQALNLAAIWTRYQGAVATAGSTVFSLMQNQLSSAPTDAFGLAGSWQPLQSGWIPSLSLGWGFNISHPAASLEPARMTQSQSWMVGLQWQDVVLKGNALGMAVGQPVFATALSGGQVPDDGGVMLEGWYQWQLTDAISVAPSLFWLSRPLGMATPAGGSLGQFGALLRTDFAF